MTILVTGATGEFGQHALAALKKLLPQETIITLARNEEKAQRLEKQGFKARIGDYNDLTSLQQAFQGINRLLFVSGSEVGKRKPQHQNVVTAAKDNNISYIAYTSLTRADISESPLATEHVYTEKLISESGIPHTYLRNNWYLENEIPLLTSALNSGKLVYAAGNGQAGWALKKDYATVAARAVSGLFDFPEVVELGGALHSYQDLGNQLAVAAHKDIQTIGASDDEAAQALADNAHLPLDVAQKLVSFQEVVESKALEAAAPEFEHYLGHPLPTLADAIKEVLNLH